MRTNSPISDPEPQKVPEFVNETPKPPASDYERIGKSQDYPQIKKRMEELRAYHQSFLPGNLPVQEVPMNELGARWIVAVTMIAEIDKLTTLIFNESGK